MADARGIGGVQRLGYLACAFGIGVFGGFNTFTLPLWLSAFTSSYLLIGLLANTRSFEGAIVSPIAGAWSDRVWLGWLGRRRPFILVAGLLAALVLALTPTIGRLSVTAAWLPAELAPLTAAIGAIFLFTFLYNLMDDVYRALLADVAEGPARTRLAGLQIVAVGLGQATILFVGAALWRSAVPDGAFVLAGLLLGLGALLTVALVREPSPEVVAAGLDVEAARAAGPLTWRRLIALYPGAALFCLVALSYWTGANAILPLLPLFARDVLGGSVGEAQLLPGLLLLGSTICALPVAWLAGRYGKRTILAVGYGLVVASALGALLVVDVRQAALVFALAGVGSAAVLVLPIPILAELVPRHRVGTAAGMLAGATSVAAPLASVLAGLVAERYGLRAVFVLMVVFGGLALALLRRVDERAVGAPGGGHPPPPEGPSIRA